MISVFRKARRKLAHNNQFLKYSRYAIGEIALVVIGILIALQINNWNENRKERILEEEMVNDLLLNLKNDLSYMEESAELQGVVIESLWSVALALENDNPMSDSLKNDFYWITMPFFSRLSHESAYENLKTTGFRIISNKAIRQRVQELYSYYKRYDKALDLYNTEFMMTINKEQNQHLLVDKRNYPKDYESLKKNFIFINTVKDMAGLHQYQLGFIEEIIAKLESLILEIEEELSNN